MNYLGFLLWILFSWTHFFSIIWYTIQFYTKRLFFIKNNDDFFKEAPALAYYLRSSQHVCMPNAAHISFITLFSIFGLDSWEYFWFRVSFSMPVKVKSHQQFFQLILLRPCTFFRLSSFLGCLKILTRPNFLARLHFLGHLQF